MDIEDEHTKPFVTNVGLITSNGPHGQNVMSAQWTYMVSYEPGMIAVCIGDGATLENITKTKEFGVSLAAQDQNIISSLAGNYSGKEIDKITALKKLGFKFTKAQKINTWLLAGSSIQFECKLVKSLRPGDHTIFIGEVVRVKHDKTKATLAFHDDQYWKLKTNVQKPSAEKKAVLRGAMQEFRK